MKLIGGIQQTQKVTLSIEEILKKAGRYQKSTLGNGDCFFNGVSIQLNGNKRCCTSSSSPAALRQKLSDESKIYIPAMDKNPNAWRRGGCQTLMASEYPKFISKQGTWAFTFDHSLMANILRDCFKKRLLILDNRLKSIVVVNALKLEPSNPKKGWQHRDLIDNCEILPEEVEKDYIVLLLSNNMHYTACPCK